MNRRARRAARAIGRDNKFYESTSPTVVLPMPRRVCQSTPALGFTAQSGVEHDSRLLKPPEN